MTDTMKVLQSFISTNYLVVLIVVICAVLITVTTLIGLGQLMNRMYKLHKLTTRNTARMQTAKVNEKMSMYNSIMLLATVYELCMSKPEEAQVILSFIRTNLPVMDLSTMKDMDPYRLNAMLSVINEPDIEKIHTMVNEMIDNLDGVASDNFNKTFKDYREAMIALAEDQKTALNAEGSHEWEVFKDTKLKQVREELKMKNLTHLSERAADLFVNKSAPTLV